MPIKPSICHLAVITAGLFSQSALAQQVDNPAYVAWAACKPGATATLKLNMDVSSPADTQTMTEKLVEVLPDVAVISITLPSGRQQIDTIPAKIDKDYAGLPSHLFSGAPEVSEIKEDKDTLEIKGKSIQMITWTAKITTSEGGKTTTSRIKSWFSRDVPGGLAKFDFVEEGDRNRIGHMTLADYSQPALATLRPAVELDDRTPQGLMRKIDRGLFEGGMAMSRAAFHADTAAGKELAEIAASFNLGVAVLEKAARNRFGAATSVTEDIDHVAGMNGCSRSDIEKAKVDIEGEKAVATYLENVEILFVKVNGHWQFDADAQAESFKDPSLKIMLPWMKDDIKLMERLAKELAEGKYKTEDDFKKSMETEMDKITPTVSKQK